LPGQLPYFTSEVYIFRNMEKEFLRYHYGQLKFRLNYRNGSDAYRTILITIKLMTLLLLEEWNGLRTFQTVERQIGLELSENNGLLIQKVWWNLLNKVILDKDADMGLYPGNSVLEIPNFKNIYSRGQVGLILRFCNGSLDLLCSSITGKRNFLFFFRKMIWWTLSGLKETILNYFRLAFCEKLQIFLAQD